MAASSDFYQLVDSFDMNMQRYWNFERKELLTDKVNYEYPSLTSGEKHILDFLIDVWKGKCQRFDFIHAAGRLSSNNRVIIADWFTNPFFV